MSKRKRDKARFQRQIQGTDIHVLIGNPRCLFRTPEGSTSTFKGDEEQVRKYWRPIKHNYSLNNSTGTLYGPRTPRDTVVIRGKNGEATSEAHQIIVKIEHAEGSQVNSFEAATYPACAQKAWRALRDMDIDRKHQEHVERSVGRTHWTMKVPFGIE